MKSAFRQSMAWLHTWVGLVLSWALYFIFLTGTLGYFDSEIDEWMRPEMPTFNVQGPGPLKVASNYLNEHAPMADSWRVYLPISRSEPHLWVFYKKDGERKSESLHPYTGEAITMRDTAGGQTLYRMHYRLHYIPTQLAYYLVGVCTMFMLLALITGVVVHKKIFKEFFTFRRGTKPTAWLDGHNLLSVMSLPFHFMITYSGLLMFLFTYMPFVINSHYGFSEDKVDEFYDVYYGGGSQVKPSGVASANLDLTTLYYKAEQVLGEHQIASIIIDAPGHSNAQATFYKTHTSPTDSEDYVMLNATNGEVIKTNVLKGDSQGFYYTLLALHEGVFASIGLRWLYFLTGLLGTAMIASGMVLWAVKRRSKAKKQQGGHLGYRLTEGINIATIVGLPTSIAGYFFANRLLPLEFIERAQWEVNTLFICWGLMIFHALLRAIQKNTDRAWIEQLYISSSLFLLLPVVNAATTSRHFVASILNSDWVFMGFDLLCIIVGAVCWLLARYFSKRFLVSDMDGKKVTTNGKEVSV